jgi:hypothetical protein
MQFTAAGKAVLFLGIITLAGCEEITDLEPDAVAVRAAHALPAVSSPTIDFTVNVAVDNFSPRLLFLEASCGWVIEKLVLDAWVPAYTAPCTLPLSPLVEIEPQTTHELTLTAFSAQRLDPEAPPPGTYRVRLAIEASYSRLRRQNVPEVSRTSNEFVVP